MRKTNKKRVAKSLEKKREIQSLGKSVVKKQKVTPSKKRKKMNPAHIIMILILIGIFILLL